MRVCTTSVYRRIQFLTSLLTQWRCSWSLATICQLALCVSVLASATLVLMALPRAQLKAPAPTFLLFDRHNRFLAQAGAQEFTGYGYWPMEKLPERVVAATLALEDRRFWYHPGVDPIAIGRALWQNISHSQRISGASTIAMQVARMQNPGPRTYARKITEVVTAVLLTVQYGRESVLRHYLRIAPYSNRSHGIAYAARRYLDKPVTDLSWAEIAFLTALPQAPSRMNPFDGLGRRRAVQRGLRILTALHEQGILDGWELALAQKQMAHIKISRRQTRDSRALHAILKVESLLREDRSGLTKYAEPRIKTTLDLDLQKQVADLAQRALQRWQADGAEHTAVIVTDRAKAEILVWLGSCDYFSPTAGAIDYTQVLRSPGSTLKPFVYAHALERGHITPEAILDDLPAVAASINNADRRFLGPLLPRQALANSRNVPATRLLKSVGIDETYLFFHDLGFHRYEQPARYYGLGMAVGALPTTLAHLVRAYGALANDGILKDLRWYQKQTVGPGQRVLSATTARQITLFLSDPLARLPSFPRMGTTEYSFPVAVKTGTSQGYRDAWAMAYSHRFLAGVWVGRSDAKPMRELGGAGSAAHLAQKILLKLHKNQATGLADLSFPPPDGYEAIELCAYTGKKSTAVCKPTLTEWFPKGLTPEDDTHFMQRTIDVRNGLLAGPWTPADKTEARTFVTLPSAYRPWAATKGLLPPPSTYSPLNRSPRGDLFTPTAATWIESSQSPQRQTVQLHIESPGDNVLLWINPETPPALNTLALRVRVWPPVPQVLWYVDGKPYQLAEPPYSVRWPLQTGDHTFQARLPYRKEKSQTVNVRVQ